MDRVMSAGQSGPFHLLDATIEGIHAAMRAGQLTSRELVQLSLDRIAAYDQRGPTLNAVQTVNPAALQEAERLDARLRDSGLGGPLHGIPVVVKDQVETSDMATTFGSAIFKEFVPARNATVVERLRAAGAVIVAKNTMSEFAQPGYHGSAFGVCRNPYDLARAPGGSSCGTAVAVAAGYGVVGVGEDTGGSIRNPASYNGLVGLRPTPGLVSRFGMLPGTPIRDTLGPMARSVRDAAILLDVMAGYDPRDPTTAYSVSHVPATYTSFLDPDGLRGLRLGVIRDSIGGTSDPEAEDYRQIRAAIDRALADMAESGAEIVDPLAVAPILELLRRPGGGGESEAAMDRYLAEHANAPVRTLREIVLAPDGQVMPSQRAQLAEALGKTTRDVGYLDMLLTREELRQAVLALMADQNLDAIVFATMEHAPPLIPADILTSPESRRSRGGNSALSPAIGFPALTVPAGLTADGLPVGINFLGRPFGEGLLFRIALAYEGAGVHRAAPKTAPPLLGEP
jgi:Asp-tRNA(Asn)/Glu-tRNA(Gln) amidotransferase A subunit family amidase